MAVVKESEIIIKVGTDENNVPEKLAWKAEDSDTEGNVKAMLLSVWDEKSKNSMRIDLWTKEMTVDEMKIFVH
ncbi:MAG: gliding motility protein GldC, partial [Flavobacteriales bacterium]|nr:gliding motility protein GldC [Flavobacteriales bacterium]